MGGLNFSYFDWPLALCAMAAMALVSAGCFLIMKRNLSISKPVKVLIVPTICLLIGFVISDFRARQVSSVGYICNGFLGEIDLAKNEWALKMK
ncbi:MAG TPA: hypothetical protein VN516_09875, partial [Candidatus Baltobacteraceae bacterium]|nr:hypothetical protein [Candidatus Baltobacteraceae bacterium]